MSEPAAFGPLLRRSRLDAGLSQEELAERAGLSVNGVSALERGRRASPRPETVRMLADALGLDPGARAALVAAARPELGMDDPAPPAAPAASPPLAAPALLLSTVAGARGVREGGAQPLLERLHAALRPREVLLLLDNCEHLVTAVAALVGDLLAACPRLAVLATSRERLRLRGEQELAVPPLAVPAPGAGTSPPSSVVGL